MTQSLDLAKKLLANAGIADAPHEIICRTTGRSGAETFEVAAQDRRFMLKIDSPATAIDAWERAVELQSRAAERGVAPAVLAASASDRAVLSPYIPDQTFVRAVSSPEMGERVLAQLGSTIGDLHAVELPEELAAPSPARLIEQALEDSATRFATPRFVEEAYADFLAHHRPTQARDFCHYDLNPSNILFDGTRCWLVDWQTAGKGDGMIDLATVVNMLLLDDARTAQLTQAYAAKRGLGPCDHVHLMRARRVAYLAYGVTFMSLASRGGVDWQRTALPTLPECFAKLMRGELDLNTDEGRWLLAGANIEGYWSLSSA